LAPPAANIAFPQSWNRYAYVLNNPLALTDPFGHDPCQGANNFEFSQDANGTGIFTPEDCAANGGTWSDGGNCSIDGAQVPCGMAMNLLSSPGGAATLCSDPSCATPASGVNPLPGGIVAITTVNYALNPDVCIPNPSLCTTISLKDLGGIVPVIPNIASASTNAPASADWWNTSPFPSQKTPEQLKACQSAYMNGRWGAGTTGFVGHFSLLSFFDKSTLGGSVLTTIGALAVKAGIVAVERPAGIITLAPTASATMMNVDAISACANSH
jgi:hypothetical protein